MLVWILLFILQLHSQISMSNPFQDLVQDDDDEQFVQS
jgi:succinate dehydrogenase hydrophobic anchor subunit